MTSKKNISFLFLTVILGWIAYAVIDRIRLNRNHIAGSATITKCEFLPKSAGSIGLEYKYIIESKEFIRSTPTTLISLKECNEFFVGKSFPIAYNPKKKELSSLLLFPDDFKRFNYPFPDSLNWVLKFVK